MKWRQQQCNIRPKKAEVTKMGQTLSEPITAKESSALQNTVVKVGSSSMQGWRITMEDAHTHILTLADDKKASFFAGTL